MTLHRFTFEEKNAEGKVIRRRHRYIERKGPEVVQGAVAVTARPAPRSRDVPDEESDLVKELRKRVSDLEHRVEVLEAGSVAQPAPATLRVSQISPELEARLQALEGSGVPSRAAFETALAGLQALAERLATLEAKVDGKDTPAASPDVGAQAARAVEELARLHEEAFARYEAALGQQAAVMDELRARLVAMQDHAARLQQIERMLGTYAELAAGVMAQGAAG